MIWRSRVAHLAAVLIAVSVLTFSLVDLLPGDAASALLGERATAEDLAAVRAELRLDDPLPVRYLRWLAGALRGDLGRSYQTGEAVLDSLMTRLPVSLELVLIAQLVALVVAVPLAIAAARRPGRLLDRGLDIASFALMSLPSYVLAVVLILIFAVELHWLPATGFVPLSESVSGNLRSLVLPGLALAAVETPLYLRVLRSDLIETLAQPYIRTARGKGLSSTRVLLRHALKPASFSLMTLIGLSIGNLLGGAVLIETIFALPGIGRLLVDAVYARDIIAVQGTVLFIALAFVLITFALDLAYALLDPRLRHPSTR